MIAEVWRRPGDGDGSWAAHSKGIEGAFSKEIGNLGHGVAMHSLLYNFGRLHLRHRWSTPGPSRW